MKITYTLVLLVVIFGGCSLNKTPMGGYADQGDGVVEDLRDAGVFFEGKGKGKGIGIKINKQPDASAVIGSRGDSDASEALDASEVLDALEALGGDAGPGDASLEDASEAQEPDAAPDSGLTTMGCQPCSTVADCAVLGEKFVCTDAFSKSGLVCLRNSPTNPRTLQPTLACLDGFSWGWYDTPRGLVVCFPPNEDCPAWLATH